MEIVGSEYGTHPREVLASPEDIDVAISDANSLSGNQLKMLIKRIAKEMTVGLDEFVVQGVTSKGSRYYKAM